MSERRQIECGCWVFVPRNQHVISGVPLDQGQYIAVPCARHAAEFERIEREAFEAMEAEESG